MISGREKARMPTIPPLSKGRVAAATTMETVKIEKPEELKPSEVAVAGPTETKGTKRPRREKSTQTQKIEGEDPPETTKSEGSLVVAKAVRSMLKVLPTPYHVSADFLPALNAKVTEIIIEATLRAQSNSRKTLRANDI